MWMPGDGWAVDYSADWMMNSLNSLSLIHISSETALYGSRTLLGLYLDNARSTTGTIECRFAGILQYCKALDIGGIDCSKRRHI